MRALGGSRRNRSLVFNRRFADQHDGNVVAYRVNAMANGALQPLSAVLEIERRFAERTYKNFQQFRVYGHSVEMVARGIPR